MDIVYVTYNSEKWVTKCFESLARSSCDLSQLSVWVFDNNSSDKTTKLLKDLQARSQNLFSGFEVIFSDKNLGFGKANNLAAAKGKDDIICFFNIDTELLPDSLESLQQSIICSPADVGMWELRQLPYEHPKYYDPATGETSWCSGAAFAIRRSVFDSLGGFDPNIFMYAEDVDLSWRVRSMGYKALYIPKVCIVHHSYERAAEIKPNQYIYSIINNLLLRYKFGSFPDIALGHLLFWNMMLRHKAPFFHAKKKLLSEYIKLNRSLFRILKSRNPNFSKTAKFLKFDYEIMRDGAFCPAADAEELPLVSVLVRTCGRPSVLRETLNSLALQTYQNFEIIVVEDGPPDSEPMIRKNFHHLNIFYYATDKKVGRSQVGNLAMEKAHGKYLNFLDDDDLFFADHIEVLVQALSKSDKRAAYAAGLETPIEVISVNPYQYWVVQYIKRHTQGFDPVVLCHHNYIPIQCIMFEKELFENYGGFDTDLDALEDWDLWVRYSLYTDFEFVPKTTSIYRVPSDQMVSRKRQSALDEALVVLRNKHKKYMRQLSVSDIASLYEKASLSTKNFKWRHYGKFCNRE